MTHEQLKGRELLERAAAILGSQGFGAWDSLAEDIRCYLATPSLLLEVDNARLQRPPSALSGALDAPHPQSQKLEPWQHIDSGDLDSAEAFIKSQHGNAAFFYRDAQTLANISLHCIREVRASRAEIARLKENLQPGLDRWISVTDELPGDSEQDIVCYTAEGFAVAMYCEGDAWFDKRSQRVTPSHFIRLTPPAGHGAAEPKGDLPQERSVNIDKDIFGTIHIKLGDFDFIQVQYQYPYVDNAEQNRITRRIQELLDPFTLTEIERLAIARDQFRELARANARALEAALREHKGE